MSKEETREEGQERRIRKLEAEVKRLEQRVANLERARPLRIVRGFPTSEGHFIPAVEG